MDIGGWIPVVVVLGGALAAAVAIANHDDKQSRVSDPEEYDDPIVEWGP